jgi:hypothetical protein
MLIIDWLLLSRVFVGTVGVFTIWVGIAYLIDSKRTLDDKVIAFLIIVAGVLILSGVYR